MLLQGGESRVVAEDLEKCFVQARRRAACFGTVPSPSWPNKQQIKQEPESHSDVGQRVALRFSRVSVLEVGRNV